MTDQLTADGDLLIRPARADDKAAVLAFTQDTWAWGDYIGYVWDDWAGDPAGSMVVGEVGGRVIGLDMMSVPRPGEGWFQGLRIDPAYRGYGYARQFEEYQIAAARRRNLRVVRFLTAGTNAPVQKNAARHGFQLITRVLEHSASADDPATQAALAAHPAPSLSRLAAEERDQAWAAFAHSPVLAAAAGCVGFDWVFAAWTRAWWDELVVQDAVWRAGDIGLVILPPTQYEAWCWLDPGPMLTPERCTTLAAAALRHVFAAGHMKVQAMLPRLPALETGLPQAGWQTSPDWGAMLLFELAL